MGSMADNVIVVIEQAETLTVSEAGTPGAAGATGATGATGQGVPTGGTANQVLAKIDGTNYNTQWVNQSGGGSSTWGGITGTLSAQTDLQSALDAKALATRTVNGHALTADVTISKSDIGLGSVDNTADASKPVSTLQAAADAAVLSSAQSYADSKVADNLTASTTVAPSKSAVNTALGLKVTANGAITGATKTKLTYDASGLITSGADATTADIADSSDKRYVTDAQLTVIGNTSGTNTGDQTNITGNAATVTTNANLTGSVVTSIGNATSITAGSITNAMMATPLTSAEVEIDFGSTPVDEGSVTVTGQTNILTTSTVDAVIMAKSTSDNTVTDAEFAAVSIRLSPAIPTAGVGFVIKAFCLIGLVSGKFKINYRWS